MSVAVNTASCSRKPARQPQMNVKKSGWSPAQTEMARAPPVGRARARIRLIRRHMTAVLDVETSSADASRLHGFVVAFNFPGFLLGSTRGHRRGRWLG